MMVVLPLSICFVLFHLTTLPLTWQDWARGAGVVIFIYVLTPMLARHPEIQARALERTPFGRLGTPDEVAAAVVWLCTDAASFMTGHAMVMDGGMIV